MPVLSVPSPVVSVTSEPINTNKAVAQVGEENIYQNILDTRIALAVAAGKKNDEELKKEVLDSFVEESILLQESKITPDPKIFNSSGLDIVQRAQTASQLKYDQKNGFDNQINGKEGYIIAVWTKNMKIPAMGYEKSKQIAREKIDSLYNEVKSGTITIQEAGEKIKNDAVIAQIDSSYKGNAIAHFKITSADDMCNTCIREMTADLWALPENGLTGIYTLHRTKDEEFYAFGQVTKIQTGGSGTYDEWFGKMKEKYALKIY